MRIAIYTGNVQPAFNKKYHYFLDEIIKQVIALHPEQEFIFLSEQPVDEITGAYPNCTWVYLQSPPDNALLLKWFLDITVPAVLKKINAGFLISTSIVSVKSKVHQCLVVPGLQYLHYPEQFSKRGLFIFSRHMRGFIKRASYVLVPSELVKNILAEKYNAPEQKMTVLPYRPTAFMEKQNTGSAIAKQLTAGKIYFLAPAELHMTDDLLVLLKAFSIFKKMQQSNTLLIISGEADNQFKQQLASYKYRKDVVIHQPATVEEEYELISKAYAIIQSAEMDDTAIYTLTAMQAAVPVVSAMNTASEDMAGDVVNYFIPGDYSDLAARMMELYKDEAGRKKLIQNGNKRIAVHVMTDPADLLWQVIQKGLQ